MNLPKHMMDAIRELVDLIGSDEIQEIEVEQGPWGRSKIRIVRMGAVPPVVHTVSSGGAPVQAPPVHQASEHKPAEPPSADASDDQYHTLRSPMVGMFYRAPNPEAPVYVEEGDEVAMGQTMCIIEAMKIMNEIEADVKGRVVRVLVENATPVEYNTPLFLIEPRT